MSTDLRDVVDYALVRRAEVDPHLDGVSRQAGDRQGGLPVQWWWASSRRLVLPLATGLIVATAPTEVQAKPLSLVGCDRVLLAGSLAAGKGDVVAATNATLTLHRRRRRPRGERGDVPDPGALPGELAAAIGGPAVRVTLTGDVVDEARTTFEPGAREATIVAARQDDHWLLMVLGDETVIAVERPVPGDDGWTGLHDRVLVVPPDDRAVALRPGAVSWTS